MKVGKVEIEKGFVHILRGVSSVQIPIGNISHFEYVFQNECYYLYALGRDHHIGVLSNEEKKFIERKMMGVFDKQ